MKTWNNLIAHNIYIYIQNMDIFDKTKEYFSESVIKLLMLQIITVIFGISFMWFTEYYFHKFYKVPAHTTITNLQSKEDLANIIQRELSAIECNYRTMLMSRNNKHIELLKGDISKSTNNCLEILDVLMYGGQYTDSNPVNFYNKDEIVKELNYIKPKDDTIPIEVIDMTPKLYDIENMMIKTYRYLVELAKAPEKEVSFEYPLILTSKQMDTLFLRCKEIGNKIYYDIQEANNKTEAEIEYANKKALAVLMTLNITVNVLIIFLTITIAKKILNILKKQRAANQTVKTILENLPFGVFIVNHDKKILNMNHVAQEIIGYDKEDIIGQVCHNVICPNRVDNCPVLDGNMVLDKSEKVVINRFGKEIPVLKTAIPIEIENEPVLLEAFTDISDQIKMQKELLDAKQDLENANENLEKIVDERTKDLKQAIIDLKETQAKLLQSEKMASVGQLAAGIAHEINNPIGYVKSNLNTFRGYAQQIFTLLEKYDEMLLFAKKHPDMVNLTDQITQYRTQIDIGYLTQETFNIINDSTDGIERVSKIIIDLKDFSHVDRPNMAEEDINIILDKTVSVAWNDLKYKAEITRDFGELPLIPCYGGQLGQVFLNILINASQAIENFGTINLKTRYHDNIILIEIADNGSGIPEDIRSKIFDPFFTTKEVGKGTGLGLNLSYKIIKSHGGNITFETERSVGTTFKITLPVKANNEVMEMKDSYADISKN